MKCFLRQSVIPNGDFTSTLHSPLLTPAQRFALRTLARLPRRCCASTRSSWHLRAPWVSTGKQQFFVA